MIRRTLRKIFSRPPARLSSETIRKKIVVLKQRAEKETDVDSLVEIQERIEEFSDELDARDELQRSRDEDYW